MLIKVTNTLYVEHSQIQAAFLNGDPEKENGVHLLTAHGDDLLVGIHIGEEHGVEALAKAVTLLRQASLDSQTSQPNKIFKFVRLAVALYLNPDEVAAINGTKNKDPEGNSVYVVKATTKTGSLFIIDVCKSKEEAVNAMKIAISRLCGKMSEWYEGCPDDHRMEK